MCTAVLLDKDLNVQYSGNVPAANQILRRAKTFICSPTAAWNALPQTGYTSGDRSFPSGPQALIAGKQLLVLCGNTVQQIAPPEQTASSAR